MTKTFTSRLAWDGLSDLESRIKAQMELELLSLDRPFQFSVWKDDAFISGEDEIIGLGLDDGVKVVLASKNGGPESLVSINSERWTTADLCSMLERLQNTINGK